MRVENEGVLCGVVPHQVHEELVCEVSTFFLIVETQSVDDTRTKFTEIDSEVTPINTKSFSRVSLIIAHLVNQPVQVRIAFLRFKSNIAEYTCHKSSHVVLKVKSVNFVFMLAFTDRSMANTLIYSQNIVPWASRFRLTWSSCVWRNRCSRGECSTRRTSALTSCTATHVERILVIAHQTYVICNNIYQFKLCCVIL